MLPRYYLNDYFPLIDSPLLKEKEYMKTDIREYQNKYIMEIDLPGLKKEDIIINYENGYLTIKATKTVNLKVEAYIRRERFYGEVKRSFYIGEKKESDIKANYESGILTITFPKEDILKNEKKFTIVLKNQNKIETDIVVLSTGSKAAPKTGSDGFGYKICEKFKHTVNKPLPALVQLRANEKYLKDWEGVRAEVSVKLYENEKEIGKEVGEIQLTNYGVSGICVFNLSGRVSKGLEASEKEKIEIKSRGRS